MENRKKIDRKKVLLIFLPLLAVAALTTGFFMLGGGKGVSEGMDMQKKQVDFSLPDAALKKQQPSDKMGFYEQAARDSAARGSSSLSRMAQSLGFDGRSDKQAGEISSRLDALNREINRPDEGVSVVRDNRLGYGGGASAGPGGNMKNDVDRLEALMTEMQENKNVGDDPEMRQLNAMMENIIDIQHPERVKQRLDGEKKVNTDSLFKAIPAVIASDKKVVQGATIKLLLLDTLRVNGVLIPKGHELFGACKITNQRLLLDIKQIRLGNAIIPADLSLYSYDGMLGLDAPEAVLTGTVNDGADNAIGGVSLNTFDQSIGAQVAGAGIDAAKSMLSKKLRKVKVKLKGGQAVLLRDNKLKVR
ncbi:conjugative transposon protein TraM [Pedobacter rhizosphaerae]|uniref:Bacteroides conjugative transposon TraM protein n=1 Tax=Pedobacter rhizosphaerae TaxID=390241 RepID=A0A1H9SZP9_9SPHI|nr:conjugative transposon protein TraM [Pedobacter rhizosphaerae]SER90492.1 Bacteroides conjugative transposon TraM protein [Pedobacter rhizosphaerae]